MLNLKAHRKDRSVAIAAAVILLLQAFFTAWTTGAAASGTVPVDTFGNPLCITSPDGSSTPHDGSVKIPNCCAMGCSMSVTTLADPDDNVQLVREFAGGTIFRFPARETAIHHRDDHDPRSPRAPPVRL
jgi:hypothetical protein